ncbi:MAG: RluA family pseudouridine synthase [Clostridiales bacterium]|nr:RluA family pseudouridine synthase [Clostridiales bacterium]
MLEHTIPSGAPEMPLDKYLRRAWPMLPSGALRALLKKRDVKRGGLRLGAKDRVAGGDVLSIWLSDQLLCPEADWLCRDGRLAAVLKPQGLPVDVDGSGIGADTLLARVRRDAPGARLLHRLDTQVGGVVLIALDDDTLKEGIETFRAHALSKRYLAVARGGFHERESTEKAWLVKDAQRARVRVTDRASRDAKPIETRIEVLCERDGLAWLHLEPVTGRTHQLRAHLAHLGHPLLMDDLYGDRALNAAHTGPLRLWCQGMTIAPDAPLKAYRGMSFETDAPLWWILSNILDIPTNIVYNSF